MSKVRIIGPAEAAALNKLNAEDYVVRRDMTADEEAVFLAGVPSGVTEPEISELGRGYATELNEATDRILGLTATQRLRLDIFATTGDRTQDQVDTFESWLREESKR